MTGGHPSWRRKINLRTRIRVRARDWTIKSLVNPWEIMRRRLGLADGDLFRHVLIQTNYRCTRKCTFCHYGLSNPPRNQDMEEALFYSIIDQLATAGYTGRIGLFEMNEPLTDKRFPAFLKYARKRLPRAWIFISSNGDLLDRQKAAELFRAGLNFIYLSSYDAAALERNTAWISELESQDHRKVHHIDRTYQIEWSSRGGNVKQFRKAPVSAPCDLVHRVCYIKPSGKIYSCYNDFYNINEMGDCNRQSLLDIWCGDDFRALRKQLDRGNRHANMLCSRCDYIGYGNLPAVPIRWRMKNLVAETL